VFWHSWGWPVWRCIFFSAPTLGTGDARTGENPQMIRALGRERGFHSHSRLALSNGLIALSGALLAQ